MNTKPETRMETQVVGAVVLWDFPSENQWFFKPQKYERKATLKHKKWGKTLVRNKRISATTLMYKLGLAATQSAILVAKQNISKIKETIDIVRAIYEALNKQLVLEGFPPVGNPHIDNVPIIHTQFVTFKDRAQRILIEKLDKQIDDLALKMEQLVNITENNRKKHVNRIKGHIRDLDKTDRLARELGINVHESDLLAEMLGKALQNLQSE